MAEQRSTPEPTGVDPTTPGDRDWHPLSSSNLAAYQYDPRDQVLRIHFTSGRQYTYEAVPEDVVQGLASAPSAGKYFNAAIKNNYHQPWTARR